MRRRLALVDAPLEVYMHSGPVEAQVEHGPHRLEQFKHGVDIEIVPRVMIVLDVSTKTGVNLLEGEAIQGANETEVCLVLFHEVRPGRVPN